MQFLHKNTGQLMYEFVLGTLQSLNNHKVEMRHNSSMSHDKPFMVHEARVKQRLTYGISRSQACSILAA